MTLHALDLRRLPPWSIARVDPKLNLCGNAIQAGAIVGGAIPTWWVVTDGTAGTTLAASIVGRGVEGAIPYVDWRISGTAGSAQDTMNIYWGCGPSTGQFAAVSGDVVDFIIFLSQVGGSLTGFINCQIYSDDFDAAHAYIGGNYSVTPFTTIDRRPLARGLYRQRHTGATALTAFKNGYLSINFTALSAVDITIRIGHPFVIKVV